MRRKPPFHTKPKSLPATSGKMANGNKFILMHIPKCAGTSLRLMIEKQWYARAVGKHYYKQKQWGLEPDLDKNITDFSEDFVIGHFGVDYFKDKPHNRKVITFMRDPIDRLLSNYYYCRSNNLQHVMVSKLAGCLSLKDFLRSDSLAVRQKISNLQTWMFISDVDIVTRYRHACYSQDTLFQKAIHNLKYFDFIGMQESFANDIQFLNTTYSWGIEEPLLTANKTKNRKFFKELDDETKDLLYGVTALDRRFYKYVKDHIYSQQFKGSDHAKN